MPFTPHPEFFPPGGGETTIWRYMDLAKFLSILDHSALYFIRLDKLADFDPFEGYYTAANLRIEQLSYEDLPNEWKGDKGFKDEKEWEAIKWAKQKSRQFVKANREVTFANSWHAQAHESAAMWSQYLKSQDGIAIQSTYERLIDSLIGYKDYEIHIGMVNYIDYKVEEIPMGNILAPFMCKRKSFEHEKELRCLIWTPQYGKNDPRTPKQNKYREIYGIHVGVKLEVLIQTIYLAPTSPAWVKELLQSLVTKFGLEKPILQSDLASVPVY
jgi:hypothetical protein